MKIAFKAEEIENILTDAVQEKLGLSLKDVDVPGRLLINGKYRLVVDEITFEVDLESEEF